MKNQFLCFGLSIVVLSMFSLSGFDISCDPKPELTSAYAHLEHSHSPYTCLLYTSRKIISEYPDFLEAYSELATALGDTGKVKEGIEIAEQGNRRVEKIKEDNKERKRLLNELEESIKKMQSKVKE